MPLYEYKCSSCAHRFERIMKFSDAPLKTCPKCHKNTVEQIISAPAIQFKGSGWYVSDYGGKNGAGTAPIEHSHDSNGNGAAKSSDSGVSATAEKPAAPAPAASASSAGATASN